MTELDLNELLDVDASVEVAALSKGSRQDRATSIDSPEYILKIDSPSDLLDENRGQSLSPQLLMDTQEVDLH